MGRSMLWGNNGMGAAPSESAYAEGNRSGTNETGTQATNEQATETEPTSVITMASSSEGSQQAPSSDENEAPSDAKKDMQDAKQDIQDAKQEKRDAKQEKQDAKQETRPLPQEERNTIDAFMGKTQHIDAKARLWNPNDGGKVREPSIQAVQRERLAPYWSSSHSRQSSLEDSEHRRGIMPLPPPRNALAASIPGAVAMVGQPYNGRPPLTNDSLHEQPDVMPDVEHGTHPPSGSLVEAIALASREFSLQEATEWGETELLRSSRTNGNKKEGGQNLLAWIVLVLLLLALALGLGVGLSRNQSKISSTGAPTMAPSDAPSSAPTQALDLLLEDLPDYSLEGLKTYGTPQWMALDWMSAHPNITDMTQQRKKQLFAMVTFYYSYAGPYWREEVRSKWLRYDLHECYWHMNTFGEFSAEGTWYNKEYGIGPNPCNENGDLFQIRLNNIGSLPASASIPSEIEFLSALSTIALRTNKVPGKLHEFLPSQLYHLPDLREIDLDQNEFSGTIPSQIGLLSDMWGLMLMSNHLTGSIPLELAKLPWANLRLEKNLLTGTLPAGFNFTHLHRFRFQSNLLSGRLPTEIGLSTRLHFFSIWGNDMTGEIPTEIGLVTTLVYLGLWQNQLTGSIPSELFALRLMDRCFLDDNLLTGTLPTEFGTMTALRRTILHGNLFSGPIPSELGLMGNATEFFAHENQLSGTSPTEIGLLPSDKLQFTFSDNALTGPLPSQLGQLSGLRRLFVDRNDLSGSIPTQFGKLTSMEALALTQTAVSGPIPSEIGRMTTIQGLYLGDTLLSGEIPSEIGLLNETRILELANMTGLTGSIPKELSNLDLQVLMLSGSVGLTGTIPNQICLIRELNCTLSRSDYWWLRYRADTPQCELQFDCTSQLCGCGCPCSNGTKL